MDPAVLLVDDRPANLLALEAILEPLQLRLVRAAPGREARKYLLQDDCALILLDVQMPDLDGFETAALIRARERTRYTPIIFVTAVHREESNIIKGYAHGALDYLVKPLESSEHERAIIERQVRHLSRLVDDLLDVSRATMGKIDLRREPLEVSTAMARAVEVSAPLIQSKKQKLTVSVPGAGLLIEGDPVRLAQVIANLLNNSAKYSEEGGNIDVYARRDGAEILITVKDDGRGIGADRLPRIFELFVQGDQPVDRSQGGLGVGLTLVRSLVALHGGCVEARSDGPGRGSEFTIRLPALADPGLSPSSTSRKPGAPRAVARRLRADPRFARVRIVALTGYGQETDKKRTSEVGIDRHLVKPVEMEQVIEAIHADDDR